MQTYVSLLTSRLLQSIAQCRHLSGLINVFIAFFSTLFSVFVLFSSTLRAHRSAALC